MELRHFKSMNQVHETSEYIKALEAFDGIPQLQELKSLAIERTNMAPGKSVLDVGCGFGLETLRLAKKVAPAGHVAGVDVSPEFVDEAIRRARTAELEVDYKVGDARRLPFADDTFDCVRAERILIYLKDFSNALAEMERVLKPGGRMALIEPDFSTNTINTHDRLLMRRIVDHETSQAVEQSYLPGPLTAALEDLGFANIEIATRVLIFPQDLGASYFNSIGLHANEAGVVSAGELEEWRGAIDLLRKNNHVFASIGYFLFTASRN
ncbi:ubiquinone/menaquinone biosynthesis C-methylase UbiE [Labrenzia sp. EL_126]|nr:ubiquinone/menaquinone biosynthesis C-methylase UbiE [Labrenzia sp. EL_126]